MSSLLKLDQSYVNHDEMGWITTSLIRSGNTVYRTFGEGIGDAEDLTKRLLSWGAKVLVDGPTKLRLFAVGGGFCQVSWRSHVAVNCAVLEESVRDQIRVWIREELKPIGSGRGSLYVMVKSMHGLALEAAGNIPGKIERENYKTKTVTEIDHAMSCLGSRDPCGRLVLLDGPPGTGKTYFIRGLVSEINAMFVLISPMLVSELSGPAVAPVLISRSENWEEGSKNFPIILIMEDADHALVHRERGDLSRLSEILNMGDGLLGNLIDIRIIATTNAGRKGLDPAVTRAGRMCSHIEFPALNKEHANAVYHRLVGREAKIKEEMTLGDIYRLARNDGWKPKAVNIPGRYE
jgi:hypothetical protein